MKRLGLAVAAILLSASVGFAQSDYSKFGKEPFAVSFDKLNKYLELESYQMKEVSNINDFFIEKQSESLRAGAKRKDAKMHEAIYGNLKLMKQALTQKQYRKYLTLINVTNNNNNLLNNLTASPDLYLAGVIK